MQLKDVPWAAAGLLDGYPLAGLEFIVVDKDFTTRGTLLLMGTSGRVS